MNDNTVIGQKRYRYISQADIDGVDVQEDTLDIRLSDLAEPWQEALLDAKLTSELLEVAMGDLKEAQGRIEELEAKLKELEAINEIQEARIQVAERGRTDALIDQGHLQDDLAKVEAALKAADCSTCGWNLFDHRGGDRECLEYHDRAREAMK